MRNVVFVAPFFQETTVRFVGAAAELSGARVVLVSQDPEGRLPARVRSALAGHYRVDDGLDPGALGEAIRRSGETLGSVDRLLGTLEELQVPLGVLRDELGIVGMGADAARNFRDKARMKAVLRAHGLPCARHALARTPDEARGFVREVGFPVIVKPPEGSGARATFRLEGPAELDEALGTLPPSGERPLLLEEFVTGAEHSYDSVCLGGRVVWDSVCHYAPTPLEVLEEPWIQWSVMIPRERNRPEYAPVREAAARALPLLGMKDGLSHMEWFLRPGGGVAVSEVGARPPGAQFTRLISYAHDFDLYRAWARLMVFDAFEPPDRPFAAGAAYLRGQGQGRVREVTGLREVFQEVGPLVVEHRLPRPGQPPSGSYEGEGWVILRHPETDVVEEGLRKLVGRIRVVLA